MWLQLNKGADTIGNFRSEQDTLQISRKDFDVGALLGQDEFVYQSNSSNAVGDKAQFIYRGDTNALYFDDDGAASNQAVLVATFQSSDRPDWLDFEIV